MNGKNDDLVQAALESQESIRRAYRLHEEHRPVMLFHLQEHRIYAYPYDGYKDILPIAGPSLPTDEMLT